MELKYIQGDLTNEQGLTHFQGTTTNQLHVALTRRVFPYTCHKQAYEDSHGNRIYNDQAYEDSHGNAIYNEQGVTPKRLIPPQDRRLMHRVLPHLLHWQMILKAESGLRWGSPSGWRSLEHRRTPRDSCPPHTHCPQLCVCVRVCVSV